MSNIDFSQLVQYGLYVLILIIAGTAQYLHIVPSGTDIFVPTLTLVVGHFFGQQPVVTVVKQTADTVAKVVNGSENGNGNKTNGGGTNV
jgi:hypothetical protein